jgi:hypothetical protein
VSGFIHKAEMDLLMERSFKFKRGLEELIVPLEETF